MYKQEVCRIKSWSESIERIRRGIWGMNSKKPYMTITFVILNVIIFLGMEIIGDTQSSAFMAEYGAMHPLFIINEGQYWRFFTAMYLHF